jgi:hypothetical protein
MRALRFPHILPQLENSRKTVLVAFFAHVNPGRFLHMFQGISLDFCLASLYSKTMIKKRFQASYQPPHEVDEWSYQCDEGISWMPQ